MPREGTGSGPDPQKYLEQSVKLLEDHYGAAIQNIACGTPANEALTAAPLLSAASTVADDLQKLEP